MSLSGPIGETIRERRESLRGAYHDAYSLRRVAQRIGIQPSYLSKVERGEVAPPGEETTRKLAAELNLNPDELLALGGKVSSDIPRARAREGRSWGNKTREVVRNIEGGPRAASLIESMRTSGTRKPQNGGGPCSRSSSDGSSTIGSRPWSRRN